MKKLQIAVGIIRNENNEIFITRRAADAHMANKLEFPDRHITLWFWLVESWEGEPWGKEGQPGEWMSLVGLNADDFPPANEPVIAKLKRVYAG